MKRVFLTTIGCLFFVLIFAQNNLLEIDFSEYTEKDNFSYIYMGQGYSELTVPQELIKEFNKIKFVKVLTYKGDTKTKEAKKFVQDIKSSLYHFKLILKLLEDNGEKTEIYIESKPSIKNPKEKFLEKIIIREKEKEISVMWIYGKITDSE